MELDSFHSQVSPFILQYLNLVISYCLFIYLFIYIYIFFFTLPKMRIGRVIFGVHVNIANSSLKGICFRNCIEISVET